MAKPKRKTLPKDFEELLKKGDMDALKAVFDVCEVNARGGLSKQTAPAFDECPDELARWLVTERGADLSVGDDYGATPLHIRAGHGRGRIAILIELGADVNLDVPARGTPLHRAADAGNLENVRLLLDHGARADALDRNRQTPLAFALQRCSNSTIDRMAPMAELLLSAMTQPAVTPEMQDRVRRIGTTFEFHRANFNPEGLEATDAGLQKLYALFDVPPVPRRIVHDGKSPIVAKAATWQARHQELWEMLVPSQGAAPTVQGEVIRIAGRIHDEMHRNGGANWDAGFKKMADAFLVHVGSANPLPAADLDAARELVSEVKAQRGDSAQLGKLAVDWVALNPDPIKLPPPSYKR